VEAFVLVGGSAVRVELLSTAHKSEGCFMSVDFSRPACFPLPSFHGGVPQQCSAFQRVLSNGHREVPFRFEEPILGSLSDKSETDRVARAV
jgi:hypothetical protein